MARTKRSSAAKSVTGAVYLRVSSDTQKTDSQQADIHRWLKRNKVAAEDVRFFQDVETGKKLDRPQFEAMQEAILRGNHTPRTAGQGRELLRLAERTMVLHDTERRRV